MLCMNVRMKLKEPPDMDGSFIRGCIVGIIIRGDTFRQSNSVDYILSHSKRI